MYCEEYFSTVVLVFRLFIMLFFQFLKFFSHVVRERYEF